MNHVTDNKKQIAVALSAVAGILAFAVLRKVGRQNFIKALTTSVTAATAAWSAFGKDKQEQTSATPTTS
ncbi:MAG: hypothetical protein JNJ45_07245 [Chthonomonas sp.]|nr:hypothetical protein [Chthonomonas sp.]